MVRVASYVSCVLVNFSMVMLNCSGLFSADIHFDCPATVPAQVREESGNIRKIEVVVPVSLTISDPKLSVTEFRSEVFWNRHAYPIVDYGPNTQLQSAYQGPIEVEKQSESNFKLGASVSSGYFESLQPSLDANFGTSKSETRRFQEIPQHQTTVASGTIKRGTGAYFQFRPSRTETLEGGRMLQVIFEVPRSWRGGVLQVNCQVQGQRKKLGLFSEDYQYQRVFVVPVYLAEDAQAKHIAREFARSEQRLRQGWTVHQMSHQSRSMASPWTSRPSLQLDQAGDWWMHHLIQSGSDVAIRRVEDQLPDKIASAANQFVEARQQLLSLSR